MIGSFATFPPYRLHLKPPNKCSQVSGCRNSGCKSVGKISKQVIFGNTGVSKIPLRTCFVEANRDEQTFWGEQQPLAPTSSSSDFVLALIKDTLFKHQRLNTL